MNGTATNPRVTLRLTYDEFVTYVSKHSGHLTCECGKRLAGELADKYPVNHRAPCTRHGETCTVEYDPHGWYWVVTTAYATETDAWADTTGELS